MSDLAETVDLYRTAARERDEFLEALGYLLRHTSGANLRAMGFLMSDTSDVGEFMEILAAKGE